MGHQRAKHALFEMRKLVDTGDLDDLQIAADWSMVYLAEHFASRFGADRREEFLAKQETYASDNGGSPAPQPVS